MDNQFNLNSESGHSGFEKDFLNSFGNPKNKIISTPNINQNEHEVKQNMLKIL
jgi:hypothetical protein